MLLFKSMCSKITDIIIMLTTAACFREVEEIVTAKDGYHVVKCFAVYPH